MKRELMVAVGGAAIVVAGLAGCSSDKKPETTVTSSGATAASGSGTTKVSIDGKDQDVKGSITCATMAGNVNIAVGEATTGIGAVLSDASPPEVKSVALGNVNGVTLGYASGVPQGSAEATKDGSTYTIKGTATGVDMANPLTPVTKPFEITVTCP